MKRIVKLTYLIVVGVLLLTSCNNVLDTKPFTSYSDETVWGNKTTAEAFIVGAYDDAFNYFMGSTSWEARTPLGAKCDQVYEGIDGVATELGLDNSSDYGFGRFNQLRNCNLIIEKVGASTFLTDGEKKALAAEGYFLRGALFFDMARKMGRFVPITKVLTPDSKDDFKTPLTKDIAESYKYVMDDLDKAVEGLPETSLPGRINKYTALIFRSRAALQAYAYTKDAKYLDVAINSSNAVITSGKYTLTSNYGDMFNDNSPKDPEIIMGIYYSEKDAYPTWFEEVMACLPNCGADDIKNAGGHLNDFSKQIFGCWGTLWPTQDMVDQYLVIDDVTGEAKPWYQTSQFVNNVDLLDVSTVQKGSVDTYNMKNGDARSVPSLADLSNTRVDYPVFKYFARVKTGVNRDISDIMYKNRDKRMDYTIIRDKTEWLGETWETNLSGNISAGCRAKEDGGWYTTVTGYYWRKGVYTPQPVINAGLHLGMHRVIARLGEAYMNLAEAYLLKNDVTNAVNALNVTRQKHGGLPPSTASTISTAWADYIRERSCEMAEENGDIYFSYLRWGKYGGDANYGVASGGVIKDLDRPVYKIGISRDRKSFCVNQLTLINSANRHFKTRRYLMPIPKGQIDRRAASGIIDTQNEGW